MIDGTFIDWRSNTRPNPSASLKDCRSFIAMLAIRGFAVPSRSPLNIAEGNGKRSLKDRAPPPRHIVVVRFRRAGATPGETRDASDRVWNFNVFFPAVSPKWLSADGRDFTLNFTGGGCGRDNDSFNTVRGRFVLCSNE